MGTSNIIRYLENSKKTIDEMMKNQLYIIDNIKSVLSRKIYNTSDGERGRIFVAGNGGSALTAQHFATDFNKRISKIPSVICLNDNIGLITAYANDDSYETIFSNQLKRYQIGVYDVFIGISYSGNSENILNALSTAKESCATTILLTSKFVQHNLNNSCDILLEIPCADIGVVEDMHLMISHLLISLLLEEWVYIL